MNQKIIAEANFIQDMLYKVYVGEIKLDSVNWIAFKVRLQSIREEARKES
jgi:hypothetical protein